MATRVELEFRDRAGWITFREEEERRPCTLDFNVLDQLDAALDEIGKNAETRAVVVLAASEKFFVVGANIAALQELNPAGMDRWIRRGHAVFNRIEDLPVPVIASVAGSAMGGGLELAMACDFIVAGDAARFAQPEATLGFLMGWGGNYRLPKLVGPARAKMLYITGRILSAAEALDFGLIAEVAPAAQLAARTAEIVAAACRNSTLGIRMTKEIINTHMYNERENAMLFEAGFSYVCSDSPDTRARMEAFFASRKKK